MFDKIILEKDPPPAYLGTGDAPALGALTQLLRVHVEEFGGFGQVERAHPAPVEWNVPMVLTN